MYTGRINVLKYLNASELSISSTRVLAVQSRVVPDLIFTNPAGAGFGIADPAGAGAECS